MAEGANATNLLKIGFLNDKVSGLQVHFPEKNLHYCIRPTRNTYELFETYVIRNCRKK